MKIALNWINQYLDRPVEAAAAQEALINAGLVVEHVEQVGGTDVLDVEVTSNRTDCLSHLGLARELAALLHRRFKPPVVTLVENGRAAEKELQVSILAPEFCPVYTARLVRNVKVGPSPAPLREALESVGLRSVNNVVDITNYVLMETGQPLHAFDFAQVRGGRLTVDTAGENESLLAIDGRSYPLDSATLVIADAVSPLAIAGIMGGKESEVTHATHDIVLESAGFDPLSIRATARRLGLSSDSSFRFQRGVDPAMVEFASRRAVQLIVDLAGGEPASGLLLAGQAVIPDVTVKLRPARIREILGTVIPLEEVVSILGHLHLHPQSDPQSGGIVCHIPSYRSDITREIDLIEEIVRVWGYGRVPLGTAVTHTVAPVDEIDRARDAVRSCLCAAGWHEAVTYSFVDDHEIALFMPPNRCAVRVSDAVRKSANLLRPSVLPGLLAARRVNQSAGQPDARLFEIARAYWQEADSPTVPPSEELRLAIVGNSTAEVLGVVELVLNAMNPQLTLRQTPVSVPGMAAGISAKLIAVPAQISASGQLPAGTPIGFAGEFSADVMKHYDLRHAAAGAELNLAALINLFVPMRTAVPVPRFPAVCRDLSLIVPVSVRWADVRDTLAAADLSFLEQISFTGTYRGKQVQAGVKSLTFSLVFRDSAGTLRSEHVDRQVQNAVELLASRFGAQLRT